MLEVNLMLEANLMLEVNLRFYSQQFVLEITYNLT